MTESPLALVEVFHIGPVGVSQPVVASWIIMAALALASRLATRRLGVGQGRGETVLIALVETLMRQIEEVLQTDARPFLPLLGSLFIYLVAANLSGLLPGFKAPTASLETTASLASIVFVSVHFHGIRRRGLFGYLKSFAKPSILMLPLNLLSEVTRHFSLAIRLFGNVMSGEFVIALVLALAGLFVPIPLMALEILVGLVQAYIFTILATVFIGAAIGSIEHG